MNKCVKIGVCVGFGGSISWGVDRYASDEFFSADRNTFSTGNGSDLGSFDDLFVGSNYGKPVV